MEGGSSGSFKVVIGDMNDIFTIDLAKDRTRLNKIEV